MRKRSPEMASPMSDSAHHSVSVRKIDNGYVRSTSRSGPDGHEHRETYHRKHPGLGNGRSSGGDAFSDCCGSSGLRGAKHEHER